MGSSGEQPTNRTLDRALSCGSLLVQVLWIFAVVSLTESAHQRHDEMIVALVSAFGLRGIRRLPTALD
jgi:hypothetical protein